MVSFESYMHFIQTQNVFRLRFEYEFFPTIQNKLLQQILGDQVFLRFNSIKQINNEKDQKIHPDQLPNKYYDEFTILRLIRIISSQPQMNQEVIKSLEQLMYYQFNQAQSIKLITEAFKKLIQQGSWFYNDNLTQSCLYASFTSISRRNTLSQPYILQALANSQLSDRLFGFFLAYFYFWMNSPNRYDFKILLQNVLKNNQFELMNTILPVVVRAVESYCEGMIDTNSQKSTIYIGQNVPDQASLMSYDLCLIRMGLFIFQNEALNQIIKVFAKKQPQKYEHLLLKMIMSIILTDHDILNVVGPQYSELPKDLKFYFRKLMYGLYLIQNYYSFNNLVINLKQTGLISLLQYEKIIHELCQLDPILRELKLKPQHQHKNIYEPIIFIDSARLRGKIHDKLLELKDSTLDHIFGNSLEYDLLTYGNDDTATMGNMRKAIIEDLAVNDQIIQHVGIPQDVHQQNMLIRLIDFHKLSLNHFGIRSEQFEYKMKMICDQIQQLRDPNQIHPKQDSIIKKILNWFSRGKQEGMEEEEVPKVSRELVLKDKKEKQMAMMKNRFQQKQTKFNDKFLKDQVIDEQEAHQDEEFEVCQGCKLNLSHGSNSICSPALIQFSNINKYIMNDTDVNLVLTSCKHLFHKECLDERFKSIKKSQLPIWVNLCCPLCKSAVNIAIPISKKTTNLAVQQFADQFKSIIDTNINMFLYFFEYVTVEQIFLRGMSLILDNLVWQMFYQTQQFIAKHQTIILENLCRLTQIYLQMHPQPKPNELNNPEPTTSIGRLQYTIKRWAIGEYSREDTRAALKAIPLDIDFALFEQILGEDCNIVVVSQTDIIRQILRERIIKNTGPTFQTMYNEYFLRACSYCRYYPKQFQSDEVAELFLCILCYSVMCKFQCTGSSKYDGEYFGNLNHHALEHHHDSTLYLSLTTGQVVIVCAPISIQGYKYLYYNKLGQRIQIQDSKLDWSSYYLDERVVDDLVELMVSYNQKSLARALEVKAGMLDVTGRV